MSAREPLVGLSAEIARTATMPPIERWKALRRLAQEAKTVFVAEIELAAAQATEDRPHQEVAELVGVSLQEVYRKVGNYRARTGMPKRYVIPDQDKAKDLAQQRANRRESTDRLRRAIHIASGAGVPAALICRAAAGTVTHQRVYQVLAEQDLDARQMAWREAGQPSPDQALQMVQEAARQHRAARRPVSHCTP